MEVFVTGDHHFRDWKCKPLWESTEAEEEEHIRLWNETVGKDDLVLYAGDFCDGRLADLDELGRRLNGRKILIKGNHDTLGDEWYRYVFEEVLDELRIEEANVRIVHVKELAGERRPGERIIYAHEHRSMAEPPPTTGDSVCVCAKWHGWKPITLKAAIRLMDGAK